MKEGEREIIIYFYFFPPSGKGKNLGLGTLKLREVTVRTTARPLGEHLSPPGVPGGRFPLGKATGPERGRGEEKACSLLSNAMYKVSTRGIQRTATDSSRGTFESSWDGAPLRFHWQTIRQGERSSTSLGKEPCLPLTPFSCRQLYKLRNEVVTGTPAVDWLQRNFRSSTNTWFPGSTIN